MRDLCLRDLVAAVLDGVQATLLVSQAEQGRPLTFSPVEVWHWTTSLEAMMVAARRIRRAGGPPRLEDLQTLIDAAAAAERTASVLALCPHDQVPELWSPARIASFRLRTDRVRLCEQNGVRGSTRYRVLDEHPQTAQAAEAFGLAITERLLPVRTVLLPLVGKDATRTEPRTIVSDLPLTRQILTHDPHIVGTEHMVSAAGGGGR